MFGGLQYVGGDVCREGGALGQIEAAVRDEIDDLGDVFFPSDPPETGSTRGQGCAAAGATGPVDE